MSEDLLDYAVDQMGENDVEHGFFDAHNVKLIKQCITGRHAGVQSSDEDYPWLFDIVCNNRSGVRPQRVLPMATVSQACHHCL